MHATQLIQLLKILSQEELQKFKEYLKTDSHSNNEGISKLFFYVKKYAPTYESPKLQREKIQKYLCSSSPNNEQQLNKLAHQLKLKVQDFLVKYDIAQQPLLGNRLLLQSLEKRNHPTYTKESKKLIHALTTKTEKTKETNDYFDLFQLNYALWSNVNTAKTSVDIATLATAEQNLDFLYYLNKLKIIVEKKAVKNIVEDNLTIENYAFIINQINQNAELKSNLIINLFLQIYQLLQSDSLEDYTIVKTTFFAAIDNLSKQAARDILLHLTNYCNRHLSEDALFFALQAFELLYFADQHAILLEHNRIRDTEFANAVVIGSYTKHFDWTEIFINKYHIYLSPDLRDTTYAYSTAYFHFQKQEFNQASQLLSDLKIADNLALGTIVKIKTLEIRAFFESWESENFPIYKELQFLIQQTNNFESFINRSKLPSRKKATYRQFTYFLRKLIKLNENPSQESTKKLMELKKKLINTAAVELRDWLLAKTEKMEAHLSL